MEKKVCKCEYPYDKCDNFCKCELTWIHYGGKSKVYYICPDCKKKNEEMLERTRANYRAQFGEDWH